MAAFFFALCGSPHTVQKVVPPYITSRHNEDNIYIRSIFLNYPASSKEMTKEGGRASRLVLLVVYGQWKANRKPAVGLLRDIMVCVVLNHSTRRRI